LFDKKFKYVGAYITRNKNTNILIYYLCEKVENITNPITKNHKTTGSRLIQEINYLRKNPKSLIPNILHQLESFQENKLHLN
jgi:hypothetical protein